jgi:hypothetical protein
VGPSGRRLRVAGSNEVAPPVQPGDIIEFVAGAQIDLDGQEARVLAVAGTDTYVAVTVIVEPGHFRLLRRRAV